MSKRAKVKDFSFSPSLGTQSCESHMIRGSTSILETEKSSRRYVSAPSTHGNPDLSLVGAADLL